MLAHSAQRCGQATPFPNARRMNLRRSIDAEPRTFEHSSFATAVVPEVSVIREAGTGQGPEGKQKEDLLLAIGPTLVVLEAMGEDAHSRNEEQKQLQHFIADPTDEKSHDEITLVTQSSPKQP